MCKSAVSVITAKPHSSVGLERVMVHSHALREGHIKMQHLLQGLNKINRILIDEDHNIQKKKKCENGKAALI